jgi:signal peptidase II
VSPRLAAWCRAGVALAAIAGADQMLKAAVVSSVARGEKEPVFPGIDLTYVRNDGVAFGAFDDGGALIAVFTSIALVLLLAYFALNSATPWLWLPVGVLLGGALGNLADRAREGSVVDYVDPVAWPAFNLADAAIVLGLLGLLYVAEGPREEK